MSTLRLRQATAADAAGMLAIYAPLVRSTIISFELSPPSPDEMAKRVASGIATHPWLVCDDRGEVAGYSYASTFRSRHAYSWTTEVTTYVAESRRGCGVGKALNVSLLNLLRHAGYATAVAVIALPNPGSVALHESLGFVPAGSIPRCGFKFGQAIEVATLALNLGEPSERLPMAPDQLGNAAWRECLALGEGLLEGS